MGKGERGPEKGEGGGGELYSASCCSSLAPPVHTIEHN